MIHLQQRSDDAKDVVSDMRVVGAGLNAPEGATDIKLKVDKSDTDFATSAQYDKAVPFSMDVIATVNGETQNLAAGHQKLDVPVKLTLSVPAYIDPEKLVLLHNTD